MAASVISATPVINHSARTVRLPSSSIRSIERPVHVANPCLIVSLIVS